MVRVGRKPVRLKSTAGFSVVIADDVESDHTGRPVEDSDASVWGPLARLSHASWIDEDAFGFRQLDRVRSPAKQPACPFTVGEHAVCMAKQKEARGRMALRKSL